MKYRVSRWVIWVVVGVVAAIFSPARVPAAAAPAAVAAADVPAVSSVFNDSPEHQAIVKLLRESGAEEILRTASSVAMSKSEDFAEVTIGYSRKDKTEKTGLYLFKEGDRWVAYPELPTRKDHPAVFSTLAKLYCAPLYKDLQGISFLDDSWQSRDPRRRTINIVCSELVDTQWQDHRLAFVFEYDERKGWHITGASDLEQPSPGAADKDGSSRSPAEPPGPADKPGAIWGGAKEAVEEIIRFIGSNPQPVFIRFGTVGRDFIQFHYIQGSAGKDILSIEWNSGQISGPQPSALAMPCPPIPFESIDFDLVPGIFAEISRKATKGDTVDVNLSRRIADGCHEPIWQGIASSGRHLLTITYALDGSRTGIEEYSF